MDSSRAQSWNQQRQPPQVLQHVKNLERHVINIPQHTPAGAA